MRPKVGLDETDEQFLHDDRSPSIRVLALIRRSDPALGFGALERQLVRWKGILSMELGLDVQKVGSHAVVDVKGEIDVYTAPKLREKLIELVSEGSYDVVVDLEGVDFLDSTGLGVLVGALKRVKAHDGSLSLVCTQDKILKIFKITGLTKVFPIHDSVDEATTAAAS